MAVIPLSGGPDMCGLGACPSLPFRDWGNSYDRPAHFGTLVYSLFTTYVMCPRCIVICFFTGPAWPHYALSGQGVDHCSEEFCQVSFIGKVLIWCLGNHRHNENPVLLQCWFLCTELALCTGHANWQRWGFSSPPRCRPWMIGCNCMVACLPCLALRYALLAGGNGI